MENKQLNKADALQNGERGTIKPQANFDAGDDAVALRKAIEGLGTETPTNTDTLLLLSLLGDWFEDIYLFCIKTKGLKKWTKSNLFLFKAYKSTYSNFIQLQGLVETVLVVLAGWLQWGGIMTECT